LNHLMPNVSVTFCPLTGDCKSGGLMTMIIIVCVQVCQTYWPS